MIRHETRNSLNGIREVKKKAPADAFFVLRHMVVFLVRGEIPGVSLALRIILDCIMWEFCTHTGQSYRLLTNRSLGYR